MKNSICRKCKGKCCGTPNISKRELELIQKELGYKLGVIKQGKLYRWVNPRKMCRFNQNGCVLKNKPLACKLFPFLPTKDGWIIRHKCPYWYKFTERNLQRAMDEFEKRKRDWVNL